MIGQLGEDVRYLAGIVGWPAAIWKVARTAALNALVVLACVVVVVLPQAHVAAKAVMGAILAIQLVWLLFLLRQVRREATQSRWAHRLASAAPPGGSPRITRPRPQVGPPAAVDVGPAPVVAHAAEVAEVGSESDVGLGQ